MDRLVKATIREIEGRPVGVLYSEILFSPGRKRFQAVVQLAEADAVVLDARTLERLEELVEATLPAAHYSRSLLVRAA